eukprot:GHVQ01026090.1.p1 GENE.GHVQ01026090.1~~GHVQ01026090.1.p1  ORF type:complete len:660 (+),score=196.03 GHVQ01026090.1:610-2589(+)
MFRPQQRHLREPALATGSRYYQTSRSIQGESGGGVGDEVNGRGGEGGQRGEMEYKQDVGDLVMVETHDGLNVKFKLRVLAELLKCPLCGGFFRNAVTIRECLHTFCRSCLSVYMYEGGETCPLDDCDEKLGPQCSDEGIAFDRTVQNIVEKIFPSFLIQEKADVQQMFNFCNVQWKPIEWSNATGQSTSSVSLFPAIAAMREEYTEEEEDGIGCVLPREEDGCAGLVDGRQEGQVSKGENEGGYVEGCVVKKEEGKGGVLMWEEADMKGEEGGCATDGVRRDQQVGDGRCGESKKRGRDGDGSDEYSSDCGDRKVTGGQYVTCSNDSGSSNWCSSSSNSTSNGSSSCVSMGKSSSSSSNSNNNNNNNNSNNNNNNSDNNNSTKNNNNSTSIRRGSVPTDTASSEVLINHNNRFFAQIFSSDSPPNFTHRAPPAAPPTASLHPSNIITETLHNNTHTNTHLPQTHNHTLFSETVLGHTGVGLDSNVKDTSGSSAVESAVDWGKRGCVVLGMGGCVGGGVYSSSVWLNEMQVPLLNLSGMSAADSLGKSVSAGESGGGVGGWRGGWGERGLKEMFFALIPWGGCDRLSRPFMKTSAMLQAGHVIRYIESKLSWPETASLELLLEGQIVGRTHTLDFICRSRKLNVKKCLIFRYTRIDRPVM